jgi:biopolymer transport protein ExbD
MAIVQPGKRPAKRFEKSKILGGKMGSSHKATNAELNVVPMVDMMTMLVIFLLNQFSSTGEVLYMQKDIKLPNAQIVVTGQKVSDVADLDRDSGYLNIPALEERLRDEKKRWDFIHQSDGAKFDGIVNIQADTKVPFRIVKRVMYSCGVAGFFNLNFAALDAPGLAASNAPAKEGG